MTTPVQTPTLWFAPPDLATDASNPAGDQFMDMFNDLASWQVTASQSVGISVSEAFILQATDVQLKELFSFLNEHHLQLMMSANMIPIQANGVGNGDVEGFTTATALSNAVNRISELGGTLNVIGMDTPLIQGHESATGAQLSITALAQQVATNVALITAVFPNVQFQDYEGLSATADLGQWAQAFQQATGHTIAAFDADVNWGLPNWQSGLEAYAAAVRATGATFGVIGDAGSEPTNVSWAVAAEANMAAEDADPLISPANVVVTTWAPNPTIILSEGEAGTLSHVAVEESQFAPLYASGYLTGGQGVTVSTVVPAASYVGSAADAVAGATVSIPGVEIVAPSAPAGMTFAVVVTDVAGALGATASGAGHVSGAGTDVMTLTGDLADINAELASLTYTGAAAGTDTIDVTTYDGVGLVDDHLIAVDIAAPVTVPLPAGIGVAALYQNIFGQAPSQATLAAAQTALTAGHTLAQVVAPWIAQAQATITALCELIQGASPTASALASLTTALVGGESIAQITTSLANAASVQSELAAVYQSQYGVAPTATQLAALTQQLASGSSLQAVEAPLLANSQAETQITTLYQNVEGQAPDAANLQTQARALLTGTSVLTITGELASSALVQENLAALYQHVYDQSPTAAQLASLTAELVGGTTYAQIEAQFTSAAQSIVTGLYEWSLGRNPTAAELAHQTQELMSGNVTSSNIQVQLDYSAESAANVTALYQQVVGQAPSEAMVMELEQCLGVGSYPVSLSQLGTDLANAATLYHQATGQTITANAFTLLVNQFHNSGSISTIGVYGGGTIVMGAPGAGINAIILENAGASYNLTANATQGLVIYAGADSDMITAGSASQSVIGLTGALHVRATAANAGVYIRGGTGSNELEITNGGTVALNNTDSNLTVALDAASTVLLPTTYAVDITGSAGNDVFVATAGELRSGLQINGGGGVNTLVLQGGGVFNLAAPAMLSNIQVVDATEGQSAAAPSIFLRNGTALTLNLASSPTNPQSSGTVVHGAANNDVIDLGSGVDAVYLGGTGETVNGGSGNDVFYVTAATIGATIKGGSGTSALEMQGGGSAVMGANITGVGNVFLLNAGTSYNFTANATQGLVIHAGGDSDSITVGSASQTVIGASGNLVVSATAANAGVAIRSGTASNELNITTAGTTAINSTDNNITVKLEAAGTLTLNHMQFIYAEGSGGNDVIIAGAKGQVLTGGGANDTLEDAGHYGVTFQDTIAGFSGDTLADFTKVDTIDITGFSSSGASAHYTGTASSGVLDVTNGGSSVNIKMSGLTLGSTFHTASDSHGGTFITYS